MPYFFLMNMNDDNSEEEEIKMLVELIFAFCWTLTTISPCYNREYDLLFFFLEKKSFFVASYKRLYNK